MSAFRPLPPKPNLAFERKHAKALLRRLRAGEPDALARARERHSAIDVSQPTRIRLADAQLVIAREYGFASWPRLVRYFGDVDRQRDHGRSVHGREFYEASVRTLLARHCDRRASAGRALAAYVPRFYGVRLDDIFAVPVTNDDARLAVARTHGFPSWDVLLDRTAAERGRRGSDWDVDPMRYAAEAMEAAELEELKRVVEAHPDLLRPSDSDVADGRRLLGVALAQERRQGRAAMRPIIAWLGTQGLDLQLELNRELCGHLHMRPDEVRWLLERGADPNWVAPNGIPVVEHALIRYWNGEAVDLVAARTTPRTALWIAAGLGDVDGVRRSLDARGKPRPQACRLRPDFDAVGPFGMLSHPDPDDEELLMEAFVIAMVNGRTAVLEYMVSRGFPIDSLIYESPVINFAVGNHMTAVVECLVRRGANLDLRGRQPDMTARELARALFDERPEAADRRRIVKLCGMDPDAILRDWDAQHGAPPGIDPTLEDALDFAADDAVRQGQSDIRPDNLLFGLLRSGGPPLLFVTQVSGMELDRFRADVRDRVRSLEHRVERPQLPLHPDAEAALQVATAIATERRRESVQGLHLLHALTQADHGPVARLLTRYGSSAATLRRHLEGSL